MKAPVPLSSHYRLLASRVREGDRETPQRFHSLGWRLAREPVEAGRVCSLYGWILRHLLAEFRDDPKRPRLLADLVERARVLVEGRYVEAERVLLQAEVQRLAPRRHRRRSVHCHGPRVLLVLRTMLPTFSEIVGPAGWLGTHNGALACAIAWMVAYYVADYDYDHFVMVGPQVADRFVVIALWCQGHMPGDGLGGMRGQHV